MDATTKRTVLAVVAATGIGVVAFLAGGIMTALAAVALYDGPVVSKISIEWVLITMLAQNGGMLAVGVIYLNSKGWSLSDLRIKRPSRVDGLWSVVGLGLLFVGLVGTTFLLKQLGLPLSEQSILNVAEDNPDVLLLLIPLSLLLVGPIEELLYRGVIHTRLKDELGVSVTIGIAAVIFAMVHFPAYYAGTGDEAVISSLVVVFALGSLLGVLYEYSGNLLVPVVVHGGYNAANFGLKYLEFTGGLPG